MADSFLSRSHGPFRHRVGSTAAFYMGNIRYYGANGTNQRLTPDLPQPTISVRPTGTCGADEVQNHRPPGLAQCPLLSSIGVLFS